LRAWQEALSVKDQSPKGTTCGQAVLPWRTWSKARRRWWPGRGRVCARRS